MSGKKLYQRLFSSLLAACLVLTMAVPAMAAKQEYTYTVRFFSGAQGTIGGDDVVVMKNLKYGERVSFQQNTVVMNDDSKYYIKGIRESGRDNNTVNNTASFPVTEDMDYVVVYGILGNSVAYTINYVDENGQTLAPSETYYGNIGDSPVIAFQYIDGYQPQTYNLTGTLGENAADNVFTFIYSPVENGTAASQGQGAAPAPDADSPAGGTGTTADGTAGDGAAGDGGAAADGDGAAGDGGAAAPDGGADADAGDAGADDEPNELENIEDPGVPLANTDLPDSSNGDTRAAVSAADFAVRMMDFPMSAKAGISSLIILIAGFIFVLYRRKNMKRKIKDE